MKFTTPLLCVALLSLGTASCGSKDSSIKDSSDNLKISANELTSAHWCQTGTQTYDAGPFGGKRSIFLNHRLVFDPAGLVEWRAFGDDGMMKINQRKAFTCEDVGAGKLECFKKEESNFIVTYEITSKKLKVNVLENGVSTDLVENTNNFYPCSPEQDAKFKD